MLHIDLTNDITWLTRIQKEFNTSKSPVEQLMLINLLEQRAESLQLSVVEFKGTLVRDALQETKDKCIENDKG